MVVPTDGLLKREIVIKDYGGINMGSTKCNVLYTLSQSKYILIN